MHEPRSADHWVHRSSATCWIVLDYQHQRPRSVRAAPCAGGAVEQIDKQRWMTEWEPLGLWQRRGAPLSPVGPGNH